MAILSIYIYCLLCEGLLLSQSLDDLGTTQGECLGRTRWSSPLDLTTYLYYFTSGCVPIITWSHVLPEHSMITWPCHMIWLPKFPCYLYLDPVIWLDVRDQMFECIRNSFLSGALITTLVSQVDLLKPYLRGGTSSPGCGSLSHFWGITVGTWEGVYCEGPTSEGKGLGECISTSLSLSSSISSIFTKDHLGGVSREEGDGNSEWVGKLKGIGGVKGLGYAGVGGKGIGASSSTPKGSGANNSISGVRLLGGVCSLKWEDGHLGKCPSSKIA